MEYAIKELDLCQCVRLLVILESTPCVHDVLQVWDNAVLVELVNLQFISSTDNSHFLLIEAGFKGMYILLLPFFLQRS